MAVLSRTNVLGNQRLNKTTYDNIEGYVCADFTALLKNAFNSDKSYILDGFQLYRDVDLTTELTSGTIPTDGNIYVKVKDSMLFHTQAEDTGAFYCGPSTDTHSDWSTTISCSDFESSQTHYIELELYFETGTPNIELFWDPSEGNEYTKNTNIIKYLKIRANISTTGWSTSTNVIKLAKISIDGSRTITSLLDYRPLFFRLARPPENDSEQCQDQFPITTSEPKLTSFEGGDKDIKDIKTWMNTIMTQIYQMKFGSAPLSGQYWYSDVSGSLYQLSNEAIMDCQGTFTWTLSTGKLTVTSDVLVVFPGSAITNTILSTEWAAATALSADGDLYYIDLQPDTTANIILNKATVSTYIDQPNRYILVTRHTNDILITALGCSILKLSDGETSSLRSELTNQFINYVGAPNSSTSNPNYSSKGAASGSINNTDYQTTLNEDLTARIAKLTSMCADYAQDRNTKLLFDDYSTLSSNIVWDSSFIVKWEGLKLSSNGNAGVCSITDNLIGQAIADGGGLIAQLNRNAGGIIALTYISDLSTITNTYSNYEHIFIILRRIGNNIFIYK